jgi:hypothetical protein
LSSGTDERKRGETEKRREKRKESEVRRRRLEN